MDTIKTIRRGMDYGKTKLNDRKKVVEDILNQTDSEIVNYFDDSFKTNLNTKSNLSHDDKVCRSLEALANYLLNSEEVKEEKAEKDFKYVFHTDQQYFNKKINRENSIEGMSADSNEGAVIHFLVRTKKNYKNSKTQVITAADLKRQDECGTILRDYNAELERITKRLQRPDYANQRYLLARASGQIRNDMVIAKDQMLGTFGYNTNAVENSDYDLSVIDLANDKHCEALLKTICKFDPNSELAFIVLAFEQTAEKANLTELQRQYYELFRKGLRNHEIAKIMNVTPQHITKTASEISQKISKEARRALMEEKRNKILQINI